MTVYDLSQYGVKPFEDPSHASFSLPVEQGGRAVFYGSLKMSWWDWLLDHSLGLFWDRFKTKKVTFISKTTASQTFFMRVPEARRLEKTINLMRQIWADRQALGFLSNQAHHISPPESLSSSPSIPPAIPFAAAPSPAPAPIISKLENEKQKQVDTLRNLEILAVKGKWGKIRACHYDWWMFPINKASSAYGDLYAFSPDDLQALKADQAFLESYRRGVRLQARAWGWDIDKKSTVEPPGAGQTWKGYGIRLAKMADSLWLMGETELFESMQQFAEKRVLPGKGLSGQNLVLGVLHMKIKDGKFVKDPNPDLAYHNPRP